MSESEQIVFVNDDCQPTGETGSKLASHTANTKLHLAFSCYIFRRSDNAFLYTQRAVTKKVWPGVWTNSVCGHPVPGESMEDAISHRAAYEVGITDLQDVQVVLSQYRYTTPPYEGIIENEFCPVYIAYTTQEPMSNPDEVEAYEWLSWSAYAQKLATNANHMSYWAKDQYVQLAELPLFKSLMESS